MNYRHLSIENYNELLGKKLPTPGGGSTLAVVLSLACSLCNMVINFTIDKKGYEHLKDDLIEYQSQINNILEKAYYYADEDSKAYSNLMEAFRSKDQEQIEKMSIKASMVPYEVYLLAERVQVIADYLFIHANKYIVSDAKIASDLCYSIYPGCVATINANIKNIYDEEVLNLLKSIIQ